MEHEEWTPAWATKEEIKTVIGLFLYDRGDGGGTAEEMETIYEWAEETRMSQYLMDCCLDGLLIPTFKEDELAFKITDKGHEMAVEALKGEMKDPKDRFIATKVLEAETGMSLRPPQQKGNDNGD